MLSRSIVRRVVVSALALSPLLAAAPALAQTSPDRVVTDAQTTLSNFMRDPDQTWIHDNIGRAKALLIVPQIVKAGFIFGGSGGQGVLVAREGTAWGGPAVYWLAAGSGGVQGGVGGAGGGNCVLDEKG